MSKLTQTPPNIKENTITTELTPGNSTNTPYNSPETSEKLRESAEIPEVIKNSYKDYAFSTWEYLTEKVGEEGEVIQTELADYLGCSRRTVQRTLNYFEEWELIEIESYNGPGKGIRIRNRWLQHERKRKRKGAWKRAFEKEAEYLRTTWTRNGQPRCDNKDNIRSIENTKKHTQEQQRGVASSQKFIKNKNLKPEERRSRWLKQFSDSEKLAIREGFQAVIMEKLRTFLEEEGLDPKAIKATCDSFWLSVKNGTLGQAREALSELKSKAEDLIGEIRTEFIDRAEDAYRIANKFIYYHILKPDTDSSKTTGHSEDVSFEDLNFDETSKTSSSQRSTPEGYGEDRAKAKRTREEGVSDIIGEIFDGDSFSLSGGKSEKSRSRLKTMKKILQNYGKQGLRRWTRNHRLSFETAKRDLLNWKPELETEFESRG